VTELRQHLRGDQQRNKQTRHATDRTSHRRSSSGALLYADWN
jgi:hypothetical protein